jgi:hypothetical protein
MAPRNGEGRGARWKRRWASASDGVTTDASKNYQAAPEPEITKRKGGPTVKYDMPSEKSGKRA